MKQAIYCIVCFVLSVVICLSLTVSAISFSDPIGDVRYGDESTYYGEVDTRPNVDITQLSAVLNGTNLTLSLTVAGVIQISGTVGYTAYVNYTDVQYMMLVGERVNMIYQINRISGETEVINGSATVSGDTLSAVFNLRGNKTFTTIYGYSKEGTLSPYGPLGELWIDDARYVYTPNSTNVATNTTNNVHENNTSSGEKTPGFESILVIVAVSITVILFRRRR